MTSAGIIEFKTDNKFLFEYTYNDVLKTGIDKYNIIYESTDLYSDLNNEFNINNIPTEYETKFHSLIKKMMLWVMLSVAYIYHEVWIVSTYMLI